MRFAGLLAHSPFDAATDTRIILCSEPTFTALTGVSDYTIIDMQVDEDIASAVRRVIPPQTSLIDKQLDNSQARTAYNTMAVFVYGFLIVIALVALINIINTVNASVSGRMNHYGVMRAAGMSGQQLKRMVTVEAATYALTGSVIGCLLGLPLHRLLFESVITTIWGIAWQPPLAVLGITVSAAVLTTLIAVISPAKKIKEMRIVDVVNAG